LEAHLQNSHSLLQPSASLFGPEKITASKTLTATITRMRFLLSSVLLLVTASELFAQSVFTQRPADPYAAYLQHGTYGTAADGAADDTPAIQAAVDHVAGTTGGGIVFVAEGRYRITHTVHLCSGIR